MKILIVFKNGKEIRKENFKQVYCNPKEDELFLIYDVFEGDIFCLSEIDYYNIEKE